MLIFYFSLYCLYDVNYKVVKEFTNNVKEKALGEEVDRSLNPGELFVKIVKDELTDDSI
jgi:signal recognition particle subunit SRP54